MRFQKWNYNRWKGRTTVKRILMVCMMLLVLVSCVYAYGIPFWKCLECGQKVQMVSPAPYGCRVGQYGRHAWVQLR